MEYLLSLDQGTSSSRAVVFSSNGEMIALEQQEFKQIFPQPGWVEHDPFEIWESQLATARRVLCKAGIDVSEIRAIGIANQRETTVVWDRRTGEPIFNAIVWQDRRTEPLCEALRASGFGPLLQRKTGLVIDPYFSGTKLQCILDQVPGARERARRGELAFGTIDSWLMWQLTDGQLHVTDVTNASRTMLYDIHAHTWDDELLAALDIPRALLPEVCPSSHLYGSTAEHLFGKAVMIGGIAGDQQAALFGQACFMPGMAKNTYGTGCFALLNTGSEIIQSRSGLIATAACQSGAAPQYALEGGVFIGGAVVQWMRDGLNVIKRSADIESLAESVPNAGGVVFVPSFTGLGAPYWKPNAHGAIVGLSRGSNVAHIARAALESIAFQSAALLQAMARETVSAITELRVDGGAAANNLMLQFQADLLGIPVIRPKIIETTALGAAYLAGLATAVFTSTEQLTSYWMRCREFEPIMSRDEAQGRIEQWEMAVRQTILPTL